MSEMAPLSPGTRSQLRLIEQLSFAAPGAALSPRQSLSDLMGSSRPPRRRAPPPRSEEPEPAQPQRRKPSAAGPPLEGADKENKKAGAKKKAGKKKATDCSSPVDGFQMLASLAGPQAAPKGKGKGKGKKRARPKAPLPDAQRTGGGKRGSLLPQSEKARRKRQAAALLSTRKSGGSAASRAGDIVDQVRAEMKQCKISQTKLGQQTLISQAVVSQWLNRCYGGHNVKVDAAMKQWIEARRKGTVVEFDPDMPASILRPARAACTVAEKQARPPPWARGKQAGGTPPGPAPASSAGSKGAAGGAGPPLMLEEGPVGAGGAAALLSALANGALGGGPVGPFA